MKRLLLVLPLVLIPFAVRAAPDAFISEIAWAGSSASVADEWFELTNGGEESADISGWTVEGAAAEPLVLPEGAIIAPGGTFLIANYGAEDPKSTLAATPDLVTTAVALPNSALHLVLRDAGGAVVDEAGASGTPPFAGTTGETRASMARRRPALPGSDPSAWETSATSTGFDAGAAELGSPGSRERPGTDAAPGSAEEPPSSVETAVPAPPPAPAEPMAALRLSEIQPFTLDDGPEWVEIVNPSAAGEVLAGWTIEDGSGASTLLEGIILPWARLVIIAPKGRLNDDGDLVVLRDGRGRVVDAVAYGAWDAPAPRVEAPKRGESAMRVAWQEAWAVTTTPTKGAANVMTPQAAPEPVTPEKIPLLPPLPSSAAPAPRLRSGQAPTGAQAEEPERIPRLQPAPQASASPFARASGDRPDGKKEARTSDVIPAKAGIQKQTKKPTTRFKGRAYEATVAVPPGVYGKTRMIVAIGGDLRELRLNRSAAGGYEPGERIRFVAQKKRDGGAEFLLANINSLSTLDVVEEPEFAPTSRWPESTGAFALEGTVSAVEARRLLLLLDGREGAVHLPAAMGKPALKPGDAVRVLGFVSATASPAAFIAEPSALTLVKGYVDPKELPDAARRLPWAAAAALTAVAVAAGVLAYLRHQRLRRLAFAGQVPFDDEA